MGGRFTRKHTVSHLQYHHGQEIKNLGALSLESRVKTLNKNPKSTTEHVTQNKNLLNNLNYNLKVFFVF